MVYVCTLAEWKALARFLYFGSLSIFQIFAIFKCTPHSKSPKNVTKTFWHLIYQISVSYSPKLSDMSYAFNSTSVIFCKHRTCTILYSYYVFTPLYIIYLLMCIA